MMKLFPEFNPDTIHQRIPSGRILHSVGWTLFASDFGALLPSVLSHYSVAHLVHTLFPSARILFPTDVQ